MGHMVALNAEVKGTMAHGVIARDPSRRAVQAVPLVLAVVAVQA